MLRTWRRRCFHGINAMILMPQIFDVTANENARYKRNELEYNFIVNGTRIKSKHVWQYNESNRLWLDVYWNCQKKSAFCFTNVAEQNKSSDIEQQLPFGDSKYNNTLHTKKWDKKSTGTSYNFDKVWSVAPVSKNKSSSGMLIILTQTKKH